MIDRTRWIALLAIAGILVFAAFNFLGERDDALAQIALPTLGSTVTETLILPGDARLSFPLRIGRVSVRDNRFDDILLEVELIRAGDVVASMSCTAYHGTPRNTGRGVHVDENGCAMTVPDGGADTLRVTPSLRQGHGGAQVEGLALLVRAETATR